MNDQDAFRHQYFGRNFADNKDNDFDCAVSMVDLGSNHRFAVDAHTAPVAESFDTLSHYSFDHENVDPFAVDCVISNFQRRFVVIRWRDLDFEFHMHLTHSTLQAHSNGTGSTPQD